MLHLVGELQAEGIFLAAFKYLEKFYPSTGPSLYFLTEHPLAPDSCLLTTNQGGFPMLSYKSTGIQKLIFDRVCQIDEELVEEDPEYQN